MTAIRAAAVAAMLVAPAFVWAQAPYSTVAADPRAFPGDKVPPYLSVADGRIATPSDAAELINLTLKTLYPTEVRPAASDFYCLIHVLRWTDPKDSKQSVQSQNWYLYHAGQDWTLLAFNSAKRLFGVKRAWIVYVHLNVMQDRVESCLNPSAAAPCLYRPRYEVFVKEKLPSNAANAVQLFTLFSNSVLEADRAPVTHVWGGGPVSIEATPSDVTIHPKLFDGDSVASLGEPQTFDNEGRHWWDVSVGVPVRSVKELEIDKTIAVATPRTIEKQRLFFLLNFFIRPIDLKATGLRRIPHIVAGAGFAERPLDRILLAAGWGPVFANFYAGALFVRQPKDSGDRRDYDPQFAMGVNLPVKAIAEKLKKPKG